MASALFSPFTLRGLTLPNRIVISPMCEYSAVDGCATDWHVIHLGHLALSGAGLLIIEATAVERAGPHQPRVPRPVLRRERSGARARARRSCAATAHARSASSSTTPGARARSAARRRPRQQSRRPKAAGRRSAPSALPFVAEWHTPAALDRAGMERVVEAFARAARALRAPRPRHDRDPLGARLPAQLVPVAARQPARRRVRRQPREPHALPARGVRRACARAWPADRPLGVRCNGTDWDERGLTPEDAVAFARALKDSAAITSTLPPAATASAHNSARARLPGAVRRAHPSGEPASPTMAVGLIAIRTTRRRSSPRGKRTWSRSAAAY